MKNSFALVFAAFLLGSASTATTARPPTREEAARQAQVVESMKKGVAAEDTIAGKFALLARLMKAEPSPDVRRIILDTATQFPGPQLDTFLSAVLNADADAGIRGQSATALGRLGSEQSLQALARAAANDATTDVMIGDVKGRASARRAATFALAELAIRFPKRADDAATALRALKAAADAKDGQQLADARVQALYQVTQDEALLKPFFERLRSPDAKTRVSGVVAFRFLKLKAAPAEVVAAQKDADGEVRSWATLVVGELEKAER